MSDEKKNVGYGVTPEHTRAKPGQVLNPRGRPKGSKNKKTLATRFLEHAGAPLEVSEQGKMSRQASIDIAIKRLRKLALTGEDGKHLKFFLDKYIEMEKVASAVAPSSYPFSDLDKQVMDEMYRRMKLCVGDVDD